MHPYPQIAQGSVPLFVLHCQTLGKGYDASRNIGVNYMQGWFSVGTSNGNGKYGGILRRRWINGWINGEGGVRDIELKWTLGWCGGGSFAFVYVSVTVIMTQNKDPPQTAANSTDILRTTEPMPSNLTFPLMSQVLKWLEFLKWAQNTKPLNSKSNIKSDGIATCTA